ncbi:MAG TPA: hypothetical protein VEL28_02180 [Candidatus Binatia bacterium]|nr:hypothetical protein [Candidatus Binatia bacterium]
MPRADAKAFSTGHFAGTLALVSSPLQTAGSFLHPQWEPAAQEISPTSSHPLLFLLGRHSNVVGTAPGFDRLPLSYNEALVGVPYVRARGGTHSFFHMARLYLDRRWPTWMGMLFGFDKNLRTVENGPGRFVVHERDGGALWSAAIVDAPGEVSAEVRQQVASIFELPFLSSLRIGFWQSDLACWMTMRNYRMQPARLQLDLRDPWVRQRGLPSSISIGGADGNPAGCAIRLEYDWTLSYPAYRFDR